MTNAPKPGSPEHMRLITASKVAAIIGVSPWESPYSMWMKMAGKVAPEETTTVQARGNYLEPAILAWWLDHNGLGDDQGREHTMQPYYTLEDWAAATPDMVACHPEHDSVLVEAKSAARLDDWDNDGDDGSSIDGIPLYYWVQLQWQMHVSGIHTAYLALIGTYLEFKEYRVEYDAAHSAAVEAHCRDFYESLKSDTPPPLDGSVATYNVVRKQHEGVDKGQTVEITPDVAAEYIEALNEAKDAADRERLAKSTLTDLMGDAAYADCNGVRVARRQASKGAASLRQVAKTTESLTESSAA